MVPSEKARFAVRSRARDIALSIVALIPTAIALTILATELRAANLFALVIGVFLSMSIRRALLRRRLVPGPFEDVAVNVREDGISLRSVSGDVMLTPKDVTRAYVQPRATAVTLMVETKAGMCEVTARTLALARAMLAALGQAPSAKPITFAFAGGLHVTVGIDGVVVAWPLLRRRRFVRHARIARVIAAYDTVVLVLDDGSKYEIATGVDVELRDALVERLQEARAAHDASDGAEVLVRLERAGRSTDAWVRESKSLTTGAGQYRTAAPPPEVLWRIVADPTEHEEKRVGAGLALRGVLDDEGRLRLRAAAESAASPRVRVALAAAADEEDDEGVIAAIDRRPARQRSRS